MALDITTTNLDPSRGPQELNPGFEKNLTRVKFEQVVYDTTPKLKKPGFFSGLLRVLGGLAPLAYVAAPFTGGLSLIAGAGMQAMGAVGQKSQQAHYAQQQQVMRQRAAAVTTYPGMGMALASDPTIATIADTRQNAMGSAIQQM